MIRRRNLVKNSHDDSGCSSANETCDRKPAARIRKSKNSWRAACWQKNKCEVEFAQLAQQQSQNPQVKEFAQMLEQDHQKIVQQLEPLAGGQAGQTTTRI